jgi:hypothetical protein
VGKDVMTLKWDVIHNDALSVVCIQINMTVE